MNICINISDSSESQSIHLLTNVINCLQAEKTNLIKEYQTLKKEKNDVDNELTELNNKYRKLEIEKKDVDNKLTELEKQYEKERTCVFIESIKQVSLMLQVALNSDLDAKWTEHINQIIDEIDNFISEVKTIKDVKLKIVSRNGWLSKVASMRWWSEASSVKNLLPPTLQKSSGFYHSFCNLQNKMKEFGIDIQIPSSDFSGKIENYNADYDEDTIVKELFPQYSTEQFVLCEINFISYNGHTGKCIGYAVN